jgi:NADPH2:quinone reductase
VRAVVLRAFGPPAALEAADVPEPVPGAGEVLVDVEAAGITWVETQVRAGRPPHPSMAPGLPAILGNGVGGRVAALGAGVDPGLAGARVVASLGGAGGGYAERAVAAAQALVPVPDALGSHEAVALLADGRTALSLAEAAALRPGETVLVLAAAGGVGTLLVQLAVRAGARVVAAARGASKLELALDLGAHDAVSYGQEGWPDRVPGGVDVALDGVGGALGRAAFELVRPGGRYLPFGMAGGGWADVPEEEAAARGVSVVRGGRPTPAASARRSAEALGLAAAGELRPVVGQTFPLGRAADAHAAMEARGTLGKTLLLPHPG